MQFLLDHLSAFFVFSSIVLIIAVMQLRGMQSNAETVVNYMVRTGTLNISEMLERDLMNMRTAAQVDSAISNSVFTAPTGVTGFECTFSMSTDTTVSFSFPTLADPQAIATASDLADAPVVQVVYQLTPQPGSITRSVGGVDLVHQLYRLDRFAADTPSGWSNEGVTFFRIEFAERGSPVFQVPGGFNCPSALSKVRFQIQMAHEGFDDITDQASKSQLNFSRYGSTVELSSWD
ncbi:MAG: hypothetical protein AB8G77_25220 [Rhodothermales bacterium]